MVRRNPSFQQAIHPKCIFEGVRCANANVRSEKLTWKAEFIHFATIEVPLRMVLWTDCLSEITGLWSIILQILGTAHVISRREPTIMLLTNFAGGCNR